LPWELSSPFSQTSRRRPRCRWAFPRRSYPGWLAARWSSRREAAAETSERETAATGSAVCCRMEAQKHWGRGGSSSTAGTGDASRCRRRPPIRTSPRTTHCRASSGTGSLRRPPPRHRHTPETPESRRRETRRARAAALSADPPLPGAGTAGSHQRRKSAAGSPGSPGPRTSRQAVRRSGPAS